MRTHRSQPQSARRRHTHSPLAPNSQAKHSPCPYQSTFSPVGHQDTCGWVVQHLFSHSSKVNLRARIASGRGSTRKNVIFSNILWTNSKYLNLLKNMFICSLQIFVEKKKLEPTRWARQSLDFLSQLPSGGKNAIFAYSPNSTFECFNLL